jgi:hypothetical protein
MRKELALLFVFIVLAGLLTAYTSNVKAQPTNIYISSDGSVVGTNNIQRNGDLYVLTDNISGGIVVQKSNIILDGAGNTLEGYGGTGIDLKNNVTDVPSSREIWNVTIKNLAIMNFNYSIETNGGGNHTFIYDYIANTTNDVRGGIFFWGCSGNNISHCTIIGEPAIYMHFVSSRNTVTENNLSGDLSVMISGSETVDRNYWADYSAKYPNASEIDSTGVGNTPYIFNSSGLVGGVLQDNHPLMNLIVILDFPALITSSMSTQGQPSSSLTPSVPEFTWLVIVPLFLSLFFVAVIIRHQKSTNNGESTP